MYEFEWNLNFEKRNTNWTEEKIMGWGPGYEIWKFGILKLCYFFKFLKNYFQTQKGLYRFFEFFLEKIALFGQTQKGLFVDFFLNKLEFIIEEETNKIL